MNLKNIETFEASVKLPGLILPVRSSLVSLTSAQILISPIEIDAASLFGVTDIVAPTLIHHLFVMDAKSKCPKAELWGVSGFQKKRSDIPWSKELSANVWKYNEELPILQLQGAPALNEVVFWHKLSRTLIVADLCFNLQQPKGLLAPVLLRLLGTYKKFNVSRMMLSYIKDKNKFKESMAELMKFDFDNLIMSHGDIVLGGAREKLEQALKNRDLL